LRLQEHLLEQIRSVPPLLNRESAQAITDLIGEIVDTFQNKLQELPHVQTIHGVSLAKDFGPT
jgi:hypothetical protein